MTLPLTLNDAQSEGYAAALAPVQAADRAYRQFVTGLILGLGLPPNQPYSVQTTPEGKLVIVAAPSDDISPL